MGAGTFPWSWLQMVAGLDDVSMDTVVLGEEGRSRGVVRCEFAPRRNSYDDPTSRMLVQAGRPPTTLLRIWDFKIHREDGSAICLHPEWQKTKVPIFSAEGFETQDPTPPQGFGQSAGRGSFQANVRRNTQGNLRFDPLKKSRTSSSSPAAVAVSEPSPAAVAVSEPQYEGRVFQRNEQGELHPVPAAGRGPAERALMDLLDQHPPQMEPPGRQLAIQDTPLDTESESPEPAAAVARGQQPQSPEPAAAVDHGNAGSAADDKSDASVNE